ncbi:MAG: methyltransferase domain-containing protein [Desulfobulbaceae bacterium]|nr:methyltransferase domain-containing protein [Desulfobulbaceae bacterium]
MESCHLCSSHKLISILEFGNQPIAHHFLTDPSKEEYVHQVTICFCEDCGLVQLVNPAPPEKFYTDYVCLSSWKSQPHLGRIVELINELPCDKKSSFVVEIGSNDGMLLNTLRQQGYGKLIGVEPARDACDFAVQRGLDTVQAYFTPHTAREIVALHGKCNLFIARQVIEHISNLDEFQLALHTLLYPGSYVLIEVPNFSFCLDAPDYSAIWEEHVNYFTYDTMRYFLSNSGIKVIRSETVNFSGNALILQGIYLGGPQQISKQEYLPELRLNTLAYRDRWPEFRKAFVNYLNKHKGSGAGIAVYGGGCRACSLINYAGVAPYIDFVVDDQAEKQNKFMPGSHLPICPGNALERDSVNLCLLAVNEENEEKVIANHQKYVARGGEFVSIHPPSGLLPPFWKNI